MGTRRGGGAETLSFPAKAAAGQDGSRPQDWARAGLYNIVTHNSWKEETRNKEAVPCKKKHVTCRFVDVNSQVAKI